MKIYDHKRFLNKSGSKCYILAIDESRNVVISKRSSCGHLLFHCAGTMTDQVNTTAWTKMKKVFPEQNEAKCFVGTYGHKFDHILV